MSDEKEYLGKGKTTTSPDHKNHFTVCNISKKDNKNPI